MIDIDRLEGVAWKNGSGVTRNLAIEPPGAGFEDFVWRVSVADVSQSAKFSVFPGIDRVIVLLSGKGITLNRASGAPVTLASRFVPFSFGGEEPIEATLIDGPTRDLNVMVRRGHAQARVDVWRTDARLAHDIDEAVFVCPSGAFMIDGELISAGHALRRSKPPAGLPLLSAAPDSVLIGALIQNPRLARERD